MIEKIPGLPDDVLGFAARGKVTARDYEAHIVPAVEEAFSRRDKMRFLYHLGEEVTGFEAAALWEDTKVGMRHLAGWERLAVATDIDWIRAAVKIFGVMMPGEVRLFHNGELDEAKRWVGEPRPG